MSAKNTLIVGGGIIGVAVARALSKEASNRCIYVTESLNQLGSITSSRNSEVVHAGLYSPPHWMKTKYCIYGRRRLVDFCEEHHVPYRNCGKLVVATSKNQIPTLQQIFANANKTLDMYPVDLQDIKNGKRKSEFLRWVEKDELLQMEKNLSSNCVAAIHSPMTCIVDSHSFLHALKDDAIVNSNGNEIYFLLNHYVKNMYTTIKHNESNKSKTAEILIKGKSGSIESEFTLDVDEIINCSGLQATSVSKSLVFVENPKQQAIPNEKIPQTYYCKGNYFKPIGGKKNPFSRLIYPIPEDAGLGVHLTMDLSGSFRFGPDVEWLENENSWEDYSIDPSRAASFYQKIRTYYPYLEDNSLEPDYCGIRPKLSKKGEPAVDFAIHTSNHHGIKGYIATYGIESPGLTSSMEIAHQISLLLRQ